MMQVTKVWWDGEKLMAEPIDLASVYKEAAHPAPVPPVAIVAEVHMSRYTLEWTNGPLPEGTELFGRPAAQPAAQEFTCSTGLCHYKAVPDPIHHTDLSEHPEYISGWNDYRQAMLEKQNG